MLWIEGNGFIVRTFPTKGNGEVYVLRIDGIEVVLIDQLNIFKCRRGEQVHFGGYGVIKPNNRNVPTVYIQLSKGGFINPSMNVTQLSFRT